MARLGNSESEDRQYWKEEGEIDHKEGGDQTYNTPHTFPVTEREAKENDAYKDGWNNHQEQTRKDD